MFQERDLPMQHITRRGFAWLAGLSFYNEAALAQLSNIGKLPPGAVKINANENPLGPCREAAEQIARAVREGGRYFFEEAAEFERVQAESEGLSTAQVRVFAGSSDPLHRSVLAYCSVGRPLVVADPGYEAAARAAQFVNAEAVSVPLRADYAHDVREMVKAAPKAGMFYICNPNNPTGTITPRADLEWLMANKPAGSVVVVDEAYLHFCEEPSAVDFVKKGQDAVVLRTFSKLFGMAGLRAGAALGRPDLLGRIASFGMGPLPAAGVIGAHASLKAKGVVEERRKLVRDIREDLFTWMKAKGYEFVPSVSNKFMVDVRRPGGEVVRAMAAKGVYIGRVWPSWPTQVRVSIGTAQEMEIFKRVFAEVMG
ncbi:MAG: pyridoxal phosphate-dependent aminotransferase [Bryobacteraceae bacterium]|nr:pyridoxal phosphate-dependent aminotransferase [Bryobacteraceae bacterium]